VKKGLVAIFVLLVFIPTGFSQIVVGSYTGITQLSNITSVCTPAVNAVLGDINFATNSGVEIPMGTQFTGTWATGVGYTDLPGPEILCVSVHTEEWWDVELQLSDMSFTAPQSAMMTTIEDYITLDFLDCSATWYYNYYYDRRVATVDFASYTIPVGLTVIGARFTLTNDFAANPDPIGMLLLQGFSGSVPPSVSNNGPLCVGDTLMLLADHLDSASYNWSGPGSFSSNLEDPIIPNATLANAGVYSCIITDSTSNIDTAYTTVVINPNPTATFVLPSLCELAPGNFSITGANDTIVAYHWDFGTPASNDTSVLAAPSFTYLNPGSFLITLDLRSDEGCIATIDTSVFVHPKPSATLSNSFACVGSSQLFNPTVSSDTTVHYAWTFPSGSPVTSTDSIPDISFPVGGATNINLILTTDYGCADTFNFPFDVSTGFNPSFGVYPICISRFTFDPLPGAGDSSWVIDWSMGDGTQFLDQDTSFFNYVYTAPGTYNVQMIVTSPAGCIDSASVPVTVQDSVFITMPNVLVNSSSVGNNRVDFEQLVPGFNLCMNYTYTIFDRWGVKVFQVTNDPYNPDLNCGSCFSGKSSMGTTLTPGVYFYVLEGNFHILKTGALTIFD